MTPEPRDQRTPMALLPYQQRWLADPAQVKVMEKSRRIGVSFATAYERVRKHSAEAWSLDSWISSRDEPTSRLVIRDCKAFAKILHVGATDLGAQVVDENVFLLDAHLQRFGARGFGAHSNDAEYILIDSIEPRMYLLSKMVMEVEGGVDAEGVGVVQNTDYNNLSQMW